MFFTPIDAGLRARNYDVRPVRHQSVQTFIATIQDSLGFGLACHSNRFGGYPSSAGITLLSCHYLDLGVVGWNPELEVLRGGFLARDVCDLLPVILARAYVTRGYWHTRER